MELHISMIPSSEDPDWRSDDYQSELRNLGLTLRARGLEIHDAGAHPSARDVSPQCQEPGESSSGLRSAQSLKLRLAPGYDPALAAPFA
jgi:hypothetical protein